MTPLNQTMTMNKNSTPFQKIELIGECVEVDSLMRSGGYREHITKVTGNNRAGSVRAEIRLRAFKDLGLAENETIKITVERIEL